MTSMSELPCYTFIDTPSDADPVPEAKLKEDLEKGDTATRTAALKKVMTMMLNGERMPAMLMTVIRYILPLSDHTIKKLLLIFWEIVPKTGQDGKLLHEMILVCDAYRKDLEHPNEFIRGSTLRFLCKLKEAELLEPLMPSIRHCLEHRHAYVRRNAVFAIFTIFRNFESLIPDAPEVVYEFLEKEQDASCKRNAFMMLIHVDQEKALDYLSSCIDQVHTFNDILQLVIVELIYKVCIANPQERARFIKCIYNLLNSSSSAVRYEAAGTLVTLSSAPTAIKAAATCYIDLVVKESDNNVKLIVLAKLVGLRDVQSHEKVLQELVMDIMRVLSSPDLEVRKKTLDLVMDLVTLRNIQEVVMILKKEITKTHTESGQEDSTSGNYRQILVRTLHTCCIKFPDVAPAVVPLLAEFLGDSNEQAALDVLLFIREAVLKFDSLKHVIIDKLLENFKSIKSVKIHRHTLWILGEHCERAEDIVNVMNEIRSGLGALPIVDDEIQRASGNVEKEGGEEEVKPATSKSVVTADGAYATQSAFTVAATTTAAGDEERPILRSYLMKGDFFIATAIGSTLCKLALKYSEVESDATKQNRYLAEAMLVMSSMIHYGTSGMPVKAATEDDLDRLAVCVKVLSERNPVLARIFTFECRNAVSSMLKANKNGDDVKISKKPVMSAQADDSIAFGQLFAKADQSAAENQFEISLLQAIGTPAGSAAKDDVTTTKLNKVTQLTGFSDPIYAEAYVNVNQYDIVLDVLIVNQTGDTLQNVTLELATLGDLKLVEKPSPVTLGGHDFSNIKASVKVASTENGIIFGNIVYDVSGGAGDRNCVVLNDIHIDVMDYIVPASCTDNEFRAMWAEFEWENKVAVNTNITETREFLNHIIKCTNMKCLTPEKAISGECGFLASNLYARSIFGEDALANLSIEKPQNGEENPSVIGHIRIRAKSQGMALSLGDKINLSQKRVKE